MWQWNEAHRRKCNINNEILVINSNENESNE